MPDEKGTWRALPTAFCAPQEPFAPPSALSAGLFDFHSARGLRSWNTQGLPIQGWDARDWAAGRLVPNCVVGSASSGSASRLLLDHAMQRSALSLATGRLGYAPLGNARGDSSSTPPTWIVLCAPHTSAAPWPAQGGSACESSEKHPLAGGVSARVERWAANGGGEAPPASSLLVIQLLPACGAGIRIARHEHWQRGRRVEGRGRDDAVSMRSRPRRKSPARVLRRGETTAAAPEDVDLGSEEASRLELAADEAYRRDTDGETPPPIESWFGSTHCALADAAAALQLWFDARNADAVLLRPDSYVYGAYTASELAGALDNVAELLEYDQVECDEAPLPSAGPAERYVRRRAHPVAIAAVAAWHSYWSIFILIIAGIVMALLVLLYL